jgi:hypothetical protein
VARTRARLGTTTVRAGVTVRPFLDRKANRSNPNGAQGALEERPVAGAGSEGSLPGDERRMLRRLNEAREREELRE